MTLFLLARRSQRSSGADGRRPLGPPPLALKLAAVLAVPAVLYALYATGLKALDNYHLNQQADGLRVEVRELREENLRLQEALLQARSDATIESIAREQLGLVKPGEQAVLLVPAAGRPAGALSSTRPAGSEAPPWQQWWGVFFGPG
jgi:cell division protein DivIC